MTKLDPTIESLRTRFTETANPPIRTISDEDEMWEDKLEHYFEIGADALACIRRALLATDGLTPKRILDLPCGHGRVLRYLQAAWPDADITACDLDRSGVDFCAATFGARPVYADLDINAFDLGREPFDVIWVGSLLTHLDVKRWEEYINLFHRSLRVGGLLIFTTLGRYAAHRMRNGYGYLLNPDEIPGLLQAFDDTGFGYVPYPNLEHYGIAFASPSWVLRGLEQRGDFHVTEFSERGWADHQDVIACEKLI